MPLIVTKISIWTFFVIMPILSIVLTIWMLIDGTIGYPDEVPGKTSLFSALYIMFMIICIPTALLGALATYVLIDEPEFFE